MPRTKSLIVTLVVFSFWIQLAAADQFALRKGDRVVFYGDSITQDGAYGQLVEAYTTTRFPGRDIRFFYAGVGGDRVSGGGAGAIDKRLARDVIALQPTVVTIMLGMNDGGYRSFDAKLFQSYQDGYRHIIDQLRKALPDVRLTLILTSPFDDITRPPQFPGGYDSVLTRYGEFVRELAKEHGATVVDFGSAVNSGLTAIQGKSPDVAQQLIPDRVHPAQAGHLVMGAALLRAWNAPEMVARVELDSSNPASVQAENTEVSQVESTGTGLKWIQKDRSLPLPLRFSEADVVLAEKAGAGLEKLDQEILRVANLKEGRYELRVDGHALDAFTAAELEQGVNLATRNTPMLSQAMPVRWNAGDRKDLQTVRRRLLVSSEKTPDLLQVASTLADFDEATQKNLQAESQPKARRFELIGRP